MSEDRYSGSCMLTGRCDFTEAWRSQNIIEGPMKAIVYTRYGPPDVLHLAEVEKPVPGKGEVLIKIFAATVNRTDCGFLRATPWIVRLFSGLVKPKYAVLGNEFAGQIEAVGEGVTSLRVGDRVFGFNDVTFGAHAEYMVMPEEAAVATMPERLSYEEAAPGLEGSHYALCDIRAAHIQKGHTVLIYGATGAIGSAAVQLVKNLGAQVTAVCGTRNVPLVKSLGADKVIDYEREDFTADDQRYDVFFDAVGKELVRQVQTAPEARRHLSFDRPGSVGAESVPGSCYSALRQEEGPVPAPDDQQKGRDVLQRASGGREVQTGH